MLHLSFMLFAAAVFLAGHFIIICGYDTADRVIYYKNPASRKGLSFVALSVASWSNVDSKFAHDDVFHDVF